MFVCFETIKYRTNKLSFVVVHFRLSPKAVLLVERLT